MAIQTPETQGANPAPAAYSAPVGPAPVGADAERARFAPITRAMYIGMSAGAGIMFASFAGFFLVSYQAFWIYTALAGVMLTAATWWVCLVLMLWRGGWALLMSPPAKSDRPAEKDETQSGR